MRKRKRVLDANDEIERLRELVQEIRRKRVHQTDVNKRGHLYLDPGEKVGCFDYEGPALDQISRTMKELVDEGLMDEKECKRIERDLRNLIVKELWDVRRTDTEYLLLEFHERAPIFETCESMRRMIRKHLALPDAGVPL